MKKRSHANNKKRLTAMERAEKVCRWWVDKACIWPSDALRKRIQAAIAAAVREALARNDRRAKVGK